MLVPSAAADQQMIVYAENFESVSSDLKDDALLAALAWEPISSFTTPTAQFSIVDGQLVADNMSESANTSYYVILPASVTDALVTDNYTVQYDLTFLDAASGDSHCGLLLNYDRVSSNIYAINYFRMKGHANAFQQRIVDSWTHLDRGDTEYTLPSGENILGPIYLSEKEGKRKSILSILPEERVTLSRSGNLKPVRREKC